MAPDSTKGVLTLSVMDYISTNEGTTTSGYYDMFGATITNY